MLNGVFLDQNALFALEFLKAAQPIGTVADVVQVAGHQLAGELLIIREPAIRRQRREVRLHAVNVSVVIGIVLLAQWAFLRPGKNWKVRLMTEGRPLKTSVFAAGLMSTFLTTGLISLILEFPDWWQHVIADEQEWRSPFPVWSVMLIIWAVWTWIFFIYWKQGDRYTQLGKMIRGLVAGSILEIMILVLK